MSESSHPRVEDLTRGLAWVRQSPRNEGVLRTIAIRPASNQRCSVERCEVTPEGGVEGDIWETSSWQRLADGSPDPEVQVTMINSRLVSLLAEDESKQILAGDQLYADLDLSEDNLPEKQRLGIGTAVFEVTPEPHTGCGKFRARFGGDALRFVNSTEGRRLRLRGVHLRVVRAGHIATGDPILKV